MIAVASRVEARISGTVSGQIAVGNHVIQNNVDHGGVVYVAAPGETPVPRQRPLPVVLRGRGQPPVPPRGVLRDRRHPGRSHHRVLVNPVVGKLVQSAGDIAAAELARFIAE